MMDEQGAEDSTPNTAVSTDDDDEHVFPENPNYNEYFIGLGISQPESQHEANLVKALKTMMDPSQLAQFKMYSESKFDFHTVRAIMHQVSKHPVCDITVFMMCELAKGFVEDVMNAALDHKRENKLEGPVTEDELLISLLKSGNTFYLGRDPQSAPTAKKARKS